MKIVRYYPRALRGDGGITMSVRKMSEAAVRAGAAVEVAVDETEVDGARDEPFDWIAVPHVGRPPFRRPLHMEHLLEGKDLLVLHSGWTFHNVQAGRAARRVGVPYVLEPRGAYHPRFLSRRWLLKRGWWWTFERSHVRNAAAIHVFFEDEVEQLRRMGYEGAVIVSPNGVAPQEGAEWDGGSGRYILWIGRFDPENKGLDLLLKGLARIPVAERPQLRLHGPDWMGGKPRTQEMVRELDLSASVTVGEPVYGDEKWRLLSQASAFTYPSRWEGFGNAAAEAVAIGLPTLVTPYPFGRWLANRASALMVDATAEGLERGLRKITSHEARELGRVGREVVRSELTWDAVGRSWLEQAGSAART